ncbi:MULTISPECIES: helix-turn-helix domain-containing protein [unclassified Marinovum]
MTDLTVAGLIDNAKTGDVKDTRKGAPLPMLELATAQVERKDKIEYWRTQIGALFDVDLPDNSHRPCSFEGSINVVNSGEVVFGRSKAKAQTFHRSRKRVASDGLDHFMVQTFAAGGGVLPDGSLVETGDMLVIDLGKPHSRISTDYDNLSLVIPRDFDANLTALLERAHDMRLSRNSPFVRLFGDHMQSLWSHIDALEKAAAGQAIRGSVALLQTYLAADGQILEEVDRSASEALGTAIRRYIEANLAGDLRPEVLAAQFRMSRAQLYRVFAAMGGVGRYVQSRRLKRSLMRLTDLSGGVASIGSIAFDCGFKSESHFSRLFKERFGMTPKQARAEHLLADGVFNAEVTDFRAWLGAI